MLLHSEGKMVSFLDISPHFLNLATVSSIPQRPLFSYNGNLNSPKLISHLSGHDLDSN